MAGEAVGSVATYGSGSGDGYGDGYGYVIAEAYADHPLIKQATRNGDQVQIALWRSDEAGRPTNGGHGDPVKPGLMESINGPLEICSRGLHGTTNPAAWTGDRWWVVALFEPVQRQDDKLASLRRLIIEELQ